MAEESEKDQVDVEDIFGSLHDPETLRAVMFSSLYMSDHILAHKRNFLVAISEVLVDESLSPSNKLSKVRTELIKSKAKPTVPDVDKRVASLYADASIELLGNETEHLTDNIRKTTRLFEALGDVFRSDLKDDAKLEALCNLMA